MPAKVKGKKQQKKQKKGGQGGKCLPSTQRGMEMVRGVKKNNPKNGKGPDLTC